MFNALFGGLLLVFVLVGQAGAQTWTELFPAGGPPNARGVHTAVFNLTNNRMIVFGGFQGGNCCSELNDVWVLSNADGLVGPSTWTQLAPTGGPPSARGVHSAVYDAVNNRMIVYAGDPHIGNCFGAVNDVWVLINADGTGGTPNWTQLSPTGGPPDLRVVTKAVYDSATNRMVVFSGYNQSCVYNNGSQVWALDNANGLGGAPVWTQLAPVGVPSVPNVVSQSVVHDSANNRVIMFGGSDLSTGVSGNNVWVLSNANGLGGTPTWTQLTPGGAVIPARAGHSAEYDPATNKMIVWGGGGPSAIPTNPCGFMNDLWVLSNANGLGGAPTWGQLTSTGGPPAARQNLSSVFHSATNRMTIFGGTKTISPTACIGGTLNDTWVLTDANGNVSFDAFAPKVEITLGPLANDDEFQVKATLTLGTNSNGIAPLTEAVTIQVGSFSATIPAGSFKFKPATPKKPEQFTFEGIINGVALDAKITPLGGNSFEFKAEGIGVNLTGTVNPVTVGLTIGNDQGSAAVTAKFE
jgi:hypothetical protein